MLLNQTIFSYHCDLLTSLSINALIVSFPMINVLYCCLSHIVLISLIAYNIYACTQCVCIASIHLYNNVSYTCMLHHKILKTTLVKLLKFKINRWKFKFEKIKFFMTSTSSTSSELRNKWLWSERECGRKLSRCMNSQGTSCVR